MEAALPPSFDAQTVFALVLLAYPLVIGRQSTDLGLSVRSCVTV